MLSKRTRRVLGIPESGRGAPAKQESTLAGAMGGKVHKRSGAGLVKWDGSSDKFVWDAKHTDGDRVALPKDMLRQISMDAISSGRVAFFELQFSKLQGSKVYVVPVASLNQFGSSDVIVSVDLVQTRGGVSVSVGVSLALRVTSSSVPYAVELSGTGWAVLNGSAFDLFRGLVENAEVVEH